MGTLFILVQKGMGAGLALILSRGIDTGSNPLTFLEVCLGFAVVNTIVVRLTNTLKTNEGPLMMLLWWSSNIVLFLSFLRFIPDFQVPNLIWMIIFIVIYRLTEVGWFLCMRLFIERKPD